MSGLNLERMEILLRDYHIDGTDHYDCDGNSLELETGLFLYSLVRRLQPKVCVETGTWRGRSAAFVACALADNHEGYPHQPSGVLYTVDKNDQGQADDAAQLWRMLGVENYIQWTLGDSCCLDIGDKRIDVLFLDAGHYEDEIMQEYRHFSPYLSRTPRASILIHDTALDEGTLKAANQIRSDWEPCSRVVFGNMRGLYWVKGD